MDSDTEQEKQSNGLALGDIYYVLFRRKWLILLFSIGGVMAAALLLFVIKPPKYQSQAKLLIKYVVDTKSPLPSDSHETTTTLEAPSTVISTEAAILKSLDLGREVVAGLGTEKILGKADTDTNRDEAAAVIVNGLELEQIPGSSMLGISFQHKSPDVARDVLSKIILAYYKKHNEMHQPVGISDFLSKETERLRAELAQTEKDLRKAKKDAGVVSPEAAQESYAEQISKIRASLFDAQAQLAAQQAAMGDTTNSQSQAAESTNSAAQPPADRISEYKSLRIRLDFFSRKEQELLTQFTDDSTWVKEMRRRIADTEKLKSALEDEYPSLASMVLPLSKTSGQPVEPFLNPALQVRALNSKIQVLKSQLSQLQDEASKVDEAAGNITELQRKKEMEESDLKNYLSSLDQTRINEAMGSERAPNISVIESPTPPRKQWSKQFKKKVAMVAAGGVFGGLALAFLLEMFIDRSVKRPGDIETKLRLPLLISIPDANRNGGRNKSLLLKNSLAVVSQDSPANAGWEQNKPLSRYYTGLRDRLLVHFEVQNLTRKPKLVAVTGCHQGAGVSSIAAGLAASLSETGDGNVLLVDMNQDQQVMQQFHKGKPAGGIAGALEPGTKQNALVQEKLYVVAERTDDERLSRYLPKRFSELVPRLKASDYDYIIFDMPSVSPTSVTPRLAGLMDMVLLVIESEKTNQDVVKKVNALLKESKANVSTVLNKTHNYVPEKLHQEYLHDA